MKTCNSCVYHYADRSGSVCNAFHSLVAASQAEQCQDYKQDTTKPVASSIQSDDYPREHWLDIHRLERIYDDGRPNELLPFAIGVSFDARSRRHRYQTFGQSLDWSYHKVARYEVDREFIEGVDTFGNRFPIAATARLLLSARIEISDPYLDLKVFDGYSEISTNPDYEPLAYLILDNPTPTYQNPYIRVKPFVLSISRLPVSMTIIRTPIAPSPDTAPSRP